MQQELTTAENWSDENGMPTGGVVELWVNGNPPNAVRPLYISWQNGPLGRGPGRIAPNGAFVETVIEAARQRIEYYQSTAFASEYNARALEHLGLALEALQERTADREAREVEGTHGR